MTARHSLAHDWFPRALPANVQLGPRSWCYSSFSCLHFRSRRPCGLRVGSDTGIYHGTFFDLGPEAEVEVGNYCTLVGAIISTNGRVIIGDYSFIAHEVVLSHHFAATPHVAAPEVKPAPADPRPIVIADNVWIGARAVILGGASLGEGAVVGAAAVVNFDVPPYAIVAGNPARIMGWAHPRDEKP